MTGVSYQHPVPAPCPRCTGYGDAHYLTCPTLRLEHVVGGKCGWCWAQNRHEGCDWAMCGCSCHDDDDDAAQGAFDMAPGHGGW